MTAPVTVAAPAGRGTPGPSSGGGFTDSAAPFASALDGALADGRGPVREATCGGGGGRQAAGDSASAGDGEVLEEAAAAPAVDTAAACVAAALWALTLAGGTPIAQASAATGVPVTGPASGLSAVGPVTAGEAPIVTVPVAAATTAAAVVPAAVADGGPALVPATTADRPTAPGAAVAATAGTPATGVAPAGSAPVPGQAPQTGPALTVVPVAAAGPVAAETAAAPAGTSQGDEPAGAGTQPVAAWAVPAPGQDAGAGSGEGRPEQQPAAGSVAAAAPADAVDAETGAAPLTAVSAPTAGPVTTTAPVAETDAATGTAASQQVSGQVSRQVALLSSAGNGSHTMTLVLTPENLGPVEVQVTVNQGNLDLHLRGAHEMGRAALIDALPELRRDLEAAGLSPSRVEVDADTGGSWLARHTAEQQAQQNSGDRGAPPNQAGERSRSGGRPADSGEGPTGPTNRSTSSGVDVRV